MEPSQRHEDEGRGDSAEQSKPESQMQSPDDTPVDWGGLLESVDADEAFVRELASLFIVNGEIAIRAIMAALDQADYPVMRQQAHSLRGATKSLRAWAASTAAERLEVAAEEGAKADIPNRVESLALEVKRMIDFLQSKVA